MIIGQEDVAHLSDNEIRRIVLRLRDAAGGEPPSGRRFTDRLAAALVRALADRCRILAVAELDYLNGEADEGEHVGHDDDPVGEAMDELHRGMS